MELHVMDRNTVSVSHMDRFKKKKKKKDQWTPNLRK